MGKCQAGDCGISCEGECICFASTKNPSDCECSCEATTLPPVAVSAFRRYAADPEALIDVQASDVPLLRIAEWFEDLFPQQILVPASQISNRITTTATGIKVGDFIKDVGLIPKSEPLRGRKFEDT